MVGWYTVAENTQAREVTYKGRKLYRVITRCNGQVATVQDFSSKRDARAAGYNVK